MKAYFHPKQTLHHPQSYLSRGQMREPQELPIRADKLQEGFARMKKTLIEPKDHGMAPLFAHHSGERPAWLSRA